MTGKVVDRSSVSEFKLERDKIGEFMLKGPGIAKGYLDGAWGNIKSMVDSEGYYSTGDLVKLHDDGSISFIRRVGLVVKLQQGEFVDLEAIESALESNPLIIAAIAYAEPDKSAPVCIVDVDSVVLIQKLGEELVGFFEAGSHEALKIVEQFVFEAGNKAIRDAGLKGFNVPKAYYIELNRDWMSDTSLYTPSSKKRHCAFV